MQHVRKMTSRTRRAGSLHALAAILLLPMWLIAGGGCTSLSGAAADSVKLLVHGHKSHVSPTAQSVAAKPYYQLKVSSKAGSALLVLGNIDHGREAWYSATGEILFLRHGVLVKTWAMQPDILATQLPADSPFRTGLQHLTGVTHTTRSLDLPGYRYGVPVDATLTPVGTETVDILGTPHQLLRVDEHLDAGEAGFRADNRYWVDPRDGFVWKSRQSIPGGLTLTLTELKPYRGEGT